MSQIQTKSLEDFDNLVFKGIEVEVVREKDLPVDDVMPVAKIKGMNMENFLKAVKDLGNESLARPYDKGDLQVVPAINLDKNPSLDSLENKKDSKVKLKK